MKFLSKLFSAPQPSGKREELTPDATSRGRDSTEFSDNDDSLLDAVRLDHRAEPLLVKLPFDTACPNCGSVMDKPIKRKRDCPDCKKVIYVRTTQALYAHSALTKEQLAHSDFYESLRYNLGVTKDDYRSTESQLKKRWNKTKINTYDVLWSLHNNMKLYERGIGSDYDQTGKLSEMLRRKQSMDIAAATYQARRGYDPSSYLQAAHNNEIQIAKLSEYIDGLTIQSYGCCDACTKFHNKTFSLKFLKETPILPIKACTRPCEDNPKFTFCNCSYMQHYSFDGS